MSFTISFRDLTVSIITWLLIGSFMGLSIAIAGAETTDSSLVLGTLRSPDGQHVDLAAPANGLSVLIFYSSECPISNAYSPTLAKMSASFPAERVKWVGICVDPDLSDADLKAHARDFNLKFPVVRDRHGALAKRLGATMTPEAFVVDAKGHVRYHGRIDDQFAKRGVRNANPSGNELQDAITSLLKGEEVKSPHVAAVGCPIPEFKAASSAPTYSKEVARILQRNCQECHRKGQVGPFALDTYEQARKRADDIAAVAEDRLMPPWKAAPNVGLKFKHDRSLVHARHRHAGVVGRGRRSRRQPRRLAATPEIPGRLDPGRGPRPGH